MRPPGSRRVAAWRSVLPSVLDAQVSRRQADRDVREWQAGLVLRIAKKTAKNVLRVLKMVMGDGCV
jgi:hypothetical protein